MSDEEPGVAQDERKRYDNIFGGAGSLGAAPLTARSETPRGPTAATRAGRGLLRWARTAAITLSVMYLLGWVTTVALVSGVTSRLWRPSVYANTEERAAIALPALSYRLPVDPRIDPEAAGRAFGSLGPVPIIPAGSGFGYKQMAHVSAPWRAIPLPRDVFPPDVGTANYGLPNRTRILSWVRTNRVNSTQRQALQMIGQADVWKAFDLVARAGAMDIVGARLHLPFLDDANFYLLPSTRLGMPRELAGASVARAAWHLSEGRRDSAEFALRSAISFGAAMMSNAVVTAERITGAAVVATGREALIQLFEMSGDPRGAALRAATEKAAADYRRPNALAPIERGDAGEATRRLLAIVEDASLPFSTRLETIVQVRAGLCTNFAGVAMGDEGVVQAAAAALMPAARFASERAMVELVAKPLSHSAANALLGQARQPGAEALVLLSRIYFNPRLVNCPVAASFR